MGKDQFVTNNLHRISGKIAEVAKKHEQELSEWKNQKRPSPAPPSEEIQKEPVEQNSTSSGPAEQMPQKEILSPGTENSAPEKTSLAPRQPQKEESAVQEQYVQKRQKLSDSTEAALLRHHEEALRLKRDLLMLMETICATIEEEYDHTEKKLAKLGLLKSDLEKYRQEFDSLQLPEREDYRYQMQLGDLYRKMDLFKSSLIHLKVKTEKLSSCGASEREGIKKQNLNFFAEMHSLKKRELFRTGFWIFFPVLLGLFLSSLLVGAALFLTFKTGL